MATEPTIKNAAEIAAARAAQQQAASRVASAKEALAAATAAAPTKAGAAILAQGGDVSAARYTALASTIADALGTDSKLSVAAQTKGEQQALTEAEKVLAGINVPSPLYDTTDSQNTSAYDMLTLELGNLGLTSLIDPLKKLFQQGITDSDTLRLKLSETPEYKTRFSANQDRINKGLRALSPAEYIRLEDQYQNIMRNYGLPSSYYSKDATGKQAGFDQLIGFDVSAAELEDRVMTAQQRVLQANPEVKQALQQFYPNITDGDILAYSLDPSKALNDIKRKVAAAEIGGAALVSGLATSATTAESLAASGITKAQAQQGYGSIASFLPTGEKLAGIYKESPYTLGQAESEIFGIAGSTEAAKKRKRLSDLEKASFSGSSGTSTSALSRDRALATQSYREPGAGAY